MAEEISTYEQIDGPGDPDPLGLDKKLKQLQSGKGTSDPLGLDAKLRSVQQSKHEQPAFKIQLSEPTFKPSDLAPTGARDFQYTEPSQPTDIYKLQGKARVAQESLQNELKNNKAALGRVVAYDRLKKQNEKKKLGLPETPEDYKVDITDEDISKVAEEAKMNQHRASEVLGAAVEINPEKSAEIQKNKYLVNAFNDAANDENGNNRVKKIEDNAKLIAKGDLVYKNGVLGKPEGFIGSLVTARNELNRLSDAYDYTKKMQSEENISGIIQELNKKLYRDPDQPVGIPTGALGNLAANIGGMPIKGMVAGAAASVGTTLLGNPEASPGAFNLASAAVNADDMYKIGYQNALEQNYVHIKGQHPEIEDIEAYKQAESLASKQAIVDAASAAAMQYLGGKVGFGASKQLAKGISAGLSEVKDELGKKAFEALGVGGIGAGGQAIKNIMSKKAGVNVPTSEGVGDQFTTGVLMTGAMSLLGLGQTVLKNATKSKIAAGLAKLPDNVVNEGLNRVEQAGHLTPEQVENVKNIINEQKILESSIPDNLPETDRLKMGDKIKERSALKQQLETVDEAFHPDIKERIKSLNEDILNISNGSERGELQSLVHKEINADNIKGYAAEVLKHAGEGEIKQYMKDIAEQAHDPATEQSTIDTFGENIVNKAKGLYPKEVPKESKISVFQPGEIKQPESIINNDNISVGELLDKEVSYKGQKGMLYQDGQTVVFKVKDANREYEIGNIDEVKNSPINNYGIEHETSVVGINKDGDVVVRGNSYKNNYSDPLMAINRDKDGNVVSVNLETKDGQKRTFRGNIAEDIAYNISLKEINKNNETRSAFEDFINSDEPTKKQIENAGLSEASEKRANEGVGKISPEKIGHVEITEHGEDTKTAAKQENGIRSSKLSEEGVKEAKELGRYLVDNNKSRIVTSMVERARQTAHEAAAEVKGISGKAIPVEFSKSLNTWDIGEYDGKPEGSFVEGDWVSKPNEAPPGGESFNSFKGRMEKAYQFVKSLPEDNHVVSHSKVMRALSALEKTNGRWTEETTKDFLTNKELTNAIQEPSASSLLQYPQEGIGETGSERGGMEQGEQGNVPAGSRAEEEGKTASAEEKAIAELTVDDAYGLPFIEEPGDKKTGIKNAISRMTRFERGLPEVQFSPLMKDADKLTLGKELVESGRINPVDVVNRVINAPEGEHGVQPNEALALQYYMHQLSKQEDVLRDRLATTDDEMGKAEINSQLQQLSDETDAATYANMRSGNAWGDQGSTRQIVADVGFNPSRDMATIKDAYGGKIPKDVQAKLDRAFKERDEALSKVAKLQAAEKAKAAEDTIKKQGATRNTKKTKEQFKSERNEIKQSISDKLKQARSGESGLTAVPLPFAKELISITPEIYKMVKSYAEEGIQKTEEVINRLHDLLKDEIDGIQKADIVNLLAGKYKEEERKLSPAAQRMRDYRTEASLWAKIAEATKMEEDTPKKKEEKNKKLAALKDRINEIKTRNKEAVKSMQDILATDEQKEMKRLTRQRRALESKYKNKTYLLPKDETKTPFSEEIFKEKQRIVNANYKIRIEKRKAFESQKSMYQKGLMWLGRGVRLSVLSGYNVLAKLGFAATIGGALKRIPEQAIGYIYGQIFKGIAEKAPIEGYVNAAAEAKFYKEFFNPKTFAKNSWEILKSGESPLSKKFSPGTYEHIPGIYLPTDLHQVIKDPLKRATYEASLKNALAWAERNGMDINDDLVIQSLETAAYKRAQYEIFQEQNWLSKKFGEWKHSMEEAGNLGATGKFLADFMIPVSTVPTNIARRMAITSPFGLIKGAAGVVEAYRKGVESLTPEQAESVYRQLKQGTLGTALWLIGWYGYSNFGGLYSKFDPNKKRDEGDLVSDEMSVGGKMVPKPVQHAIPLEIIQFAATARRVYDNYKEDKGKSTPEAIEKAALASIGALSEQIPVVETVAHTIGAFNDPYEAKKLEEDAKRRFQPQILRETGVIEDDKKGIWDEDPESKKQKSKGAKHTITHKIHR